MSLVIFRSSADLNPIILDATLSAEYAHESETSSNPVEEGADIVDHSRSRPERYRFEGLALDIPSDAQAARRRSDAGEGALDDPLAATREIEPVDDTRATTILSEILALYDAKAAVTIVTGLFTDRNMLLDSLTYSTAGKGAIRISGVFRRVRFARTQFSEVAIPKEEERAAASPTTEQGTKGGGSAEQELIDSIAASASGWKGTVPD